MLRFSPKTRAVDVKAAEGAVFDLIVVGGGINGAGVLWDASTRGLSTLVLEKADFASGTSSKSSKLIHGGLRYLKHFDFRMTRESCVERNLLAEQVMEILDKVGLAQRAKAPVGGLTYIDTKRVELARAKKEAKARLRS